jgi:hypothetical protein
MNLSPNYPRELTLNRENRGRDRRVQSRPAANAASRVG